MNDSGEPDATSPTDTNELELELRKFIEFLKLNAADALASPATLEDVRQLVGHADAKLLDIDGLITNLAKIPDAADRELAFFTIWDLLGAAYVIGANAGLTEAGQKFLKEANARQAGADVANDGQRAQMLRETILDVVAHRRIILGTSLEFAELIRDDVVKAMEAAGFEAGYPSAQEIKQELNDIKLGF